MLLRLPTERGANRVSEVHGNGWVTGGGGERRVCLRDLRTRYQPAR